MKQDPEFYDDMAGMVIAALMCGANSAEAVAVVYPEFFRNGKAIPAGRNKTDDGRLPSSKWRPLRTKVLERDGYVCTYCLAETAVVWCVDHIKPLSRGGSNDEDNLTCCCQPCNTSKGDRLLSEWAGRI